MFLTNKTSPLFLLLTIALITGCGQKKDSCTSSKKQKSSKNKKSKKSLPESEIGSLVAESSIMYNYGPGAFLEEDLDSSYLETLALSDAQSYQLKTSNGSQLPETASHELEKLAMAWESKSSKVDEAFQLWAENESDFYEQDTCKTVFFDYQKAEIDEINKEVIENNFKTAKKASEDGKKILIRGHCDPSEPKNQSFALSFDRARAVKDELVKMGIEPNIIEIVAVGPKEPLSLADEDWPEASSLEEPELAFNSNCRAEILLS